MRSTMNCFQAAASTPQHIDIKQTEEFTIKYPLIFKQNSPLDYLVMVMNVIHRIFPGSEVMLYVLDSEM